MAGTLAAFISAAGFLFVAFKGSSITVLFSFFLLYPSDDADYLLCGVPVWSLFVY